ncbi:MAG: 16S rRNA (uracil(1498)-N(3))-methyltransferase [Spirochaetaceae bacterium]|jgi:16S rRNA (uracil1498-N3)-methyltransferase|nr:16S rRNA (uracil(1498)-N(3))-methyltransferase [Spirochaetaceae bacterium]
MKQFLLSEAPEQGPQGPLVRLRGKDYHYLVRVRRLEPGMLFRARLPGGEPVLLRVISTEGGILTGELAPEPGDSAAGEPRKAAEKTPEPRIILFQALPKGAKMDLIVRQAAEAGLAEIVPFRGRRSETGAAEGGQRFSRWERIIREARQQSGSAIDTRLHPPLSLEEALAYWEELRARCAGAVGLILHPPEGPHPLEKGSFHDYLDKDPGLVVTAIGPEGGFAPEELSRFFAAGFKPLSLGNTVLRTETAALFASAAIRIILLENSSWILKPGTKKPDPCLPKPQNG